MKPNQSGDGASRLSRNLATVVLVAAVMFMVAGCGTGTGQSDGNGLPANPRSPAPQLDRGTFGIIEDVPGGTPAFPAYALAFAWKPQSEDYQDHELWLFYKLDEKDPQGLPIGFQRPGEGLPQVNLHVVLELAGDPPGTDTSDGIDATDHEAFRQWAIGVWQTKYGKPGVTPVDLVLNHHVFGTY